MANCADCGEKFGFIAMLYGENSDLCKPCYLKRTGKGSDGELLPLPSEVESIIITTETTTALPVKKRIRVIMEAIDCTLDVDISKAQTQLLNLLKGRAFDVGANAVVGLDINFVETYAANIGAGEFKRFKMVAYGTAVIIEE